MTSKELRHGKSREHLEETVDFFTGDMTGWTLRDIEISNSSLLVSYRPRQAMRLIGGLTSSR